MSLRALFVGRHSRSEMIGLFLATLELVRQRRVRVTQPDTGGDIHLVLRPEADRNDLDSSDGAKPLTAAPEAAPKDLSLDDVAGFDWPDEATRRRVERRIRLRAAHREAAEADAQSKSESDLESELESDLESEEKPNALEGRVDERHVDSAAESTANPVEAQLPPQRADVEPDGGTGPQPVPLPDAQRTDPGTGNAR